MNESLLNLYCNYHPDFLEKLEIFSVANKKRILKNLKSTKQKNIFLSTVAEIKFGELFNSLNLEIEYEKKFYTKQTPDWSLNFENSIAICEVYRLGKSEKDEIFSNFENQIRELLEKLQYNYFIKIHLFNEDFDITKFEVEIIINELKSWLKSSSKIVGDKVIICDLFVFEIIKVNTNINHICSIGPAKSIDYKPQKLKQIDNLRENEISKKLKKYNEIISKEELAYFICVYIDFISGFDIEDFKEYFLGIGVENIDFETAVGKSDEFKHLGSTWTELGEFYNNLQLSGIIIFYNNSFYCLMNPIQKQVIHNQKNYFLKEKLLSINH